MIQELSEKSDKEISELLRIVCFQRSSTKTF